MKLSTALWMMAAILLFFFVAIKVEQKYFPPKTRSFLAHIDLIDVRPVEDISKDEAPPQDVVEVPAELGNA